MVRIQLIEPQVGFLDVKEGTIFPLNFSVSDIRDLSSRSSSFSKTIQLIGNQNNNQLLNHYYDVNTVAGTFDVNKLQKCVVIQDGVVVLNNAYLRLLAVTRVSQSKVNTEQLVEYQAMVFNQAAELFTRIGNAELKDIDFSDLNHVYEASHVISTFTHTVADKYKYILPYVESVNGNNDFNLNELKMAIYAKEYFDRIFARAGYSYEWTNINDTEFPNLLIPYNGDAIKVSPEYVNNNEVIAEEASIVETDAGTGGVNQTTSSKFIVGTEVKDIGNHYDDTTGEFTSPLYTAFGNGSLEYFYEFDYALKLDNTSAGTAYLRGGASLCSYNYTPQIGLRKNATGNISWKTIGAFTGVTVNTGTSTTYTIPAGVTTLLSGSANIVQGFTPLNVNDILENFVQVKVNRLGNATWRDADDNTAATVDVEVSLEITNLRMRIKPNITNIGYLSDIIANDHLPIKVKQSDFVKSIFKMFNCYVEPKPNEENVLVITQRDEYYDSGVIKDWTAKVARDKESIIQFLPELTTKKKTLTYKPDTDPANAAYTEATEEVYGQLEFTFTNEFIKGESKEELIFSPTPVAQNDWGLVLPLINGYQPKNNVRVLYDGGAVSCNPYRIRNTPSNIEAGITTYPIITHFDNPLQPSLDINFGICDYYFYQIPALTNNNLFTRYHRRQLNQINEGVMLTCYVNLTPVDIALLKLNDRIFIDSQYYNINKVIDYNGNGNDLTKVELITADPEMQYIPYEPIDLDTGVVRPTEPNPNYIEGVGKLIDDRNEQNNLNYSTTSRIYGVGNFIPEGENLEVRGYDNTVSGIGFTVEGSNRTVIEPDPIVYRKVYNIGAWDMDATGGVDVPHDLTLDEVLRVVNVNVMIINDAQTNIRPLFTDGNGGTAIFASLVNITRRMSGVFDSTNYDDATINRGYIYIEINNG
jgi:hypothetical protein